MFRKYTFLLVLVSVVLLALAIAGCAFSGLALPFQTGPTVTPTVHYTAPTYAMITPGPKKVLADLSTIIETPPFPYSAPLPPSVPTVLDGLYSRMIPMEGTPTPCKRCAGYRIEGGVWTLYLDKGVFKMFQRESEFEAVGSYAVSGNNITFFNDPYCEEDITMTGTYEWQIDARGSLHLTAQKDACSIGLRAKNLTASPWVKTAVTQDERSASCQPPNREAAISDHWFKPPLCEQTP
jgi:hypothetical protein